VDARQGRTAAALRRVAKVLDTQSRERPMTDRQGDLVNVADLVFHLGRPDLALPVLEALHRFEAQTDHKLRAWVADRARELTLGIPATVQASNASARAEMGSALPEGMVSLVLG
jgi:hypothetical protein